MKKIKFGYLDQFLASSIAESASGAIAEANVNIGISTEIEGNAKAIG